MKTSKEAPKTTTTWSGTPAEIGGKIFEQMCLPAIRHTSNHATPQALAQLYLGFLSAAMGAMVADFGPQGALEGAQLAVDSLAGMVDKFEGTRVQ